MERSVLVRLVVAIVVILVQVSYWASVACTVDRYATGCGYWRSGGPGRLLPWPSPPGYLAVLTAMEPWDTALCVIFQSGAFVAAAVVFTFGSDFLARRYLLRRQSLTNHDDSP